MADQVTTEAIQVVTEYITQDGDRWDLVAYKATGDPSRMSEIADLNPDVTLDTVFIAGIRLFVPIIEEESVNENLLPPWKR